MQRARVRRPIRGPVYRGSVLPAVPVPSLPSDLDGRHVLVVPAGTDALELGRAWFVGATWDIPPTTGELSTVPRAGGGRFRGGGEVHPPRLGLLRLTATSTLVGPQPYTRAPDGLLARDVDLYALHQNVDDVAVLGWMTAAARRTGGAVVPADRTSVIAPDPAAAVALTLWTGAAIGPDELLPLVRPALVGARLGPPQPVGPAPADGPVGSTLTAAFEYDGTVRVTAGRRDEVPVALSSHGWGPYGPWAYQVSWLPLDPDALDEVQPSRLHVIARSRIAPVVARAVRALWSNVGGVVVDDGGFVVSTGELSERSSNLT